jgi:hypothetical protein
MLDAHMTFRDWLRQLWLENCTERDSYNQLPYSQQEYFQRHKYWLKREYRHKNSLINQ